MADTVVFQVIPNRETCVARHGLQGPDSSSTGKSKTLRRMVFWGLGSTVEVVGFN